MVTFADVYPGQTVGQLMMFDRIVFKGHLSGLYPAGKRFSWYLCQQGVLLKAFKPYAEQTTQQVKAQVEEIGRAAGCAVEYLANGRGPKGEKKEELAQQRLAERGGQPGLIGIWSALEVQNSFTVRGNRQTHHLEVVVEPRKHLHYYLYYNDEEFGLMYVRLQSWWPMAIQIGINGHQWLARQLDKAGIGYERHDNCFPVVEDLERAQALCDKFAHRPWERVWNNFARRVNPLLSVIEATMKKGYYWSIDQCEIATDVMFGEQETLEALLPGLFQETLLTFSAEDVMRFLGRKLSGNFQGRVQTNLQKRPAGWRVKHWVKENSLKMYNKGGLLRVETTINNSGEFKIPAPQGQSPRWQRMPKGVSYFWHFYQTGREANQRYLDALHHLPAQGKAATAALDSLCQSHDEQGQRIAKFEPTTQATCHLFAAVLNGQHALTGFRNRHLRMALYSAPAPDEQTEQRRRARVSRLMAKLRGHGLIERLEHAHLYRVTTYGFQAMAAALRYRLVEYPTNFALVQN
jgi:hypothetical protein